MRSQDVRNVPRKPLLLGRSRNEKCTTKNDIRFGETSKEVRGPCTAGLAQQGETLAQDDAVEVSEWVR